MIKKGYRSMTKFLFVFLTACSSITVNQSLSSYYGKSIDSLYYISVKDLNTGKSNRVTGVAIAENLIMTVSHALPRSHKNFKITVNSGFRNYKGTVVEDYETSDLLLIRIDKNIVKTFNKNSDIVISGDVVNILTVSKRGVIDCKEGVINEVNTFTLKVQGYYPKGYSGSVVLNSRKEILGILVRSNFEEVDKEKYGVILRIEAVDFLISGELN